ncbi:MAG: response regulator transcription factor [Bacteroidota bacterium]
MQEPIKILLVDDHKVVRDGIRSYLEDDGAYEVVEEAGDGLDALNKLKKITADIVMIDINMPGMDGITATKEITTSFPDTKVLALTMHDAYQHIRAMLDAGASGYLLKSCDQEEVKKAISTILDGDNYFSNEVTHTVMNNLTKKKAKAVSPHLTTPLTEREKEVYKLILEENSNKEIADKLFISVRTVEVHKRNLLEKTGAKNTAGLVLFAVNNNLMEEL